MTGFLNGIRVPDSGCYMAGPLSATVPGDPRFATDTLRGENGVRMQIGLDAAPAAIDRPLRHANEHKSDILTELGLSAEEIATFKAGASI